MRKEEKIRAEKAAQYDAINWRTMPTVGVDSGAFGRACELKNATPASRKTSVSARGKVDNYISIYDALGRLHRYEAESKVNGGRLDHIIELAEAMRKGKRVAFILYTLDVCNKNTGYQPRKADTIIVPADVFMSAVERIGAMKTNRHNGEVRGYSLQHTLKAWFDWVVDYPVKYQPAARYEAWEFIGVE
jgi:hypothetical protein